MVANYLPNCDDPPSRALGPGAKSKLSTLVNQLGLVGLFLGECFFWLRWHYQNMMGLGTCFVTPAFRVSKPCIVRQGSFFR